MGYKWKTRPYKHQVQAVKFLLKNGYGGALLMEPRTGKTKTTIDYLSILALQKKIDRVLIVCPARVIGVWVDEFNRHSDCRIHITIWDKDARKLPLPQPQPNLPYDLWVVLTNYEAFATPGRTLASGRRSKASGRFSTRSKLQKWVARQPAACVLDESHKIKSPSGKAANMIVNMAPMFAYRVILTGTPVTKAKRAFDIYMQWKFLNPHRFDDLPTVKQFKDFYGKWLKKDGYEKWIGPKNIDHLKARIHLDSFTVRREDCFDLPPIDRQIVSVPLTTSGRAYDQMASHMVAQLESGAFTEASIKLVQTLRLAQITSGFARTVEGPIERVGSEKLNALKELLDEYWEHDEKVVIAAHFKADLTAIARLGASMGFKVFELRGGMKRVDTDQAILDFRNTEDAAIFVVQPQAGSLGIDLSTASRMVWYSLTNSWVNYTQTCDRIALSKRSTTFTYLLAKGTVDELLYQSLLEDTDVARLIMEKPERLLRSIE